MVWIREAIGHRPLDTAQTIHQAHIDIYMSLDREQTFDLYFSKKVTIGAFLQPTSLKVLLYLTPRFLA